MIKYILPFVLLNNGLSEANAQFENSHKVLPAPFTTTVKKNQVLYLIDSVYFDNDSTTAFPPLPNTIFQKNKIKKLSSFFDRDGIAPYLPKPIPNATHYIMFVRIDTIDEAKKPVQETKKNR